nr:MAG TPA: hypothetical protein [Caudoviricetes sp.]
MLLRQSNKSKRTDIFRPFFCTQKDTLTIS